MIYLLARKSDKERMSLMMLFLWLHDQMQYHVDIEMEGRRNHQ